MFRKNKVTWAKGFGTLKPGNVVDVKAEDGTVTTYTPRNVILATGSVPVELPYLKFDEERIVSNVGALKLHEVPGQLIVIGRGVIGLELGSVWRRLGAQVTVIEFMPAILPGNDDDIIKEARTVAGITLVTAQVEAQSMDELKSLGDALRARLHSGVGILGARLEDKAGLVCVVTDDIIKEKKLQAGAIVGAIAKIVGGGGGGRPHLATAGGKDPARIGQALDGAESVLTSFLIP